MLHALARAYAAEAGDSHDADNPQGASSASSSTSSASSNSAPLPARLAFHPCIAALRGTVEAPLGLVVEYCAGGNLMAALGSGGQAAFPWALKRSVAADVASGVAFLHRQRPPVLHRDLKSLNILLDGAGRAKVSDFGLSRAAAAQDHLTAMCGTYHWMAPEVMNAAGPVSSTPGIGGGSGGGGGDGFGGSPGGGGGGSGGRSGSVYGTPVDVYSFAIVCWELATCAVPYDGWAAPQVIVAVAHRGDRLPLPAPRPDCRGGGGVDEGSGEAGACPAAFLRLIEACWAHDPADRPSFAAVEAALADMPSS